MPISEELLKLLACPACVAGKEEKVEAPLRLEDERLICDLCGRRYPIVDGIPNLVIEDAELGPEESEQDGPEAT
jgi:uncharacterized protein YbaR (Trm112 family)